MLECSTNDYRFSFFPACIIYEWKILQDEPAHEQQILDVYTQERIDIYLDFAFIFTFRENSSNLRGLKNSPITPLPSSIPQRQTAGSPSLGDIFDSHRNPIYS